MTKIVPASDLNMADYLTPGDSIVWGQACGEPTTLIKAFIEASETVSGLSGFAATSFSGLLTPESCQNLHINSMGAMGSLRGLAKAGQLGIIPCHVSQIGPYIDQGIIGCDVALLQLSPADKDGYHSFGLIADFVQNAAAKARIVIAEINDRVPHILGGAKIHGSKIDCAIRISQMPVEVNAAPVSETDMAIARHISDFIDDGSVLQIGIGGVPDAVLRLVTDRKDLGIHSGMIGDGIVDLIENGVATNARKTIDTGVSVTGALIGSRRLYDFADNNAALAMRESGYTHSSEVLSKLSNLVCINSAVEVDLTGQVNAEQSGDRYLGGTGGQADFIRAGHRAPGGHSIIALPSTARGGTVSRITAQLSGPVTTARSDVDIVVTEFGAAQLRGQTLSERARRLAAITHPDFRGNLNAEAAIIQKRGF